jgi:fatty acid desaturase
MVRGENRWLLIAGIAAVVAVLLALGLSPNTLLILGAALLCPAAMYLGMVGMQHGCGHSGKCSHQKGSDTNKLDYGDRNRAV